MKSTDNIEKSYRDRFDTNSIQNEGWNEPRGQVWDKIEKDLFDKRKNRYGLIPLILVGFLASTLIFTFYLYSQNVELKNVIQEASILQEPDGISDKQTVSSPSNSSIEVKKSDITYTTAIQKEVSKKSIVNKQTIDPKNDLINNSSFSKNNFAEKKLILSSVDKVKNQALQANGTVEALDGDGIKNSGHENELLGSALDYPRDILQISNLSLIGVNLDYDRELQLQKTIHIEKEEGVRRPYLSFLPIVAVGLLQTKGSQETALTELIDKEYGNTGLGFDLLYSVPINKSLDFSIGLGVESMNFSTEYDITLPYVEEDETVVGEKAFIDFEHSLPTAFGNTETALTLSRKRASDALNESNVNLDFNTQHNFISLALPLGLKYRFGGNKSFFSLGLNARPTYIIKATSSIQSVFSHHSGIDAINNESISAYSKVRKLNVGLGLEMGYSLFLNDKSGLNLNLSLHDYWFDFYEVNDFSSTVRKAGVSIGYLHTL